MSAIHLIPLGNVDSGIVDGLLSSLHETFHLEVKLKPANIDLGQFYDRTRGQYNSTSILQHLRDEETNGKVLAVLNGDLFIPILTYVFGEAELSGSAAVVSYHRLQSERYGLPPNFTLLVQRTCKEAIHELGHTFGLLHCSSQDCVMHTSTYVEDIDLKGESFCSACKAVLMQAPKR